MNPVKCGVTSRIEVTNEHGRRWAHRHQHAVQRAPEEIDTPVGQARGEQSDELAVGGVGIAERILDGVAREPRIVVEVAIEPLERFLQRGG